MECHIGHPSSTCEWGSYYGRNGAYKRYSNCSTRIRKDNEDMQRIIKHFGACFNLLHLIQASNIPEDVKKRHEISVKQYLENGERLKKPIRKRHLRTSASECVSNRMTCSNTKEAQRKCSSGLLSRIAFIAGTPAVDIEVVHWHQCHSLALSVSQWWHDWSGGWTRIVEESGGNPLFFKTSRTIENFFTKV